MSNTLIRDVGIDLAVYLGVDSIKKGEMHLQNWKENGAAILIHRLFMSSLVSGKLTGIVPEAYRTYVEDYISRLVSLYGSDRYLFKSRESFSRAAEDQLGYSIGLAVVAQLRSSGVIPVFGAIPSGSSSGTPSGSVPNTVVRGF